MKFLLCLVFCSLQSIALLAHQDTPLKWKKDGTLKGLPKKYSPASFDRNSFTLKIGEKGIVIPEFITERFNHSEGFSIAFYSSWYHDTELMPHYVYLNIKSHKESTIHQIFFNLETLEIFKIQTKEKVVDENEQVKYNTHEQAISKAAIEIILNAIFKL